MKSIFDSVFIDFRCLQEKILSQLDELYLNYENSDKISKPVEGCKFLEIVSFKDLTTWNTEKLNNSSVNKNLQAFVRKLQYMTMTPTKEKIGIGSPSSCKKFIDSVCTGKIKAWRDNGTRNKRVEKTIKKKFDKTFFLTKCDCELGHFRFEGKGYVLSKKEINHIKNFFYGSK